MTTDDGKIIDLGARLRRHREQLAREVQDHEDERLRNLAYQAAKLPTTLSRSEIAELGRAMLHNLGCASRMV